MSIPVIAIVGRPNVGKSTLFNRMIGRRVAIVEDLPGVTRDRNYEKAFIEDRPVTLVDTGGFDVSPDDPMLTVMKQQVELAMAEADVIVLLFDARDGLTPADEEIVAMFRGSGRPIIPVANKVDGQRQELEAAEFYKLGLDDIIMMSAAHNRGIGYLEDRIIEILGPQLQVDSDPDGSRTRVAVVGRPNAGKSTLINQLLGENRLLTSDMPGTTRDAIDTRLDMPDGRGYLLIDTAGIRRKARISDKVERYSVLRALGSIERAQVVLILVDTTRELADQDSRIISMAHEAGRAYAVIANKWDLVDKHTNLARDYERDLKSRLPFIKHAPVLFVSALSGQRTLRIPELVDQVRNQWERRISTSEVNRFLEEAVERFPPPLLKRSKRLRFYYATQAAAAPPTFVISCSYPDKVPQSYKRYLINRIRDTWGFFGSPIRLIFKGRGATAAEREK